MASSSRIIGAADVTDVRAFKLGELRQEPGAAHQMPGHRSRAPEEAAPPEPAPSGPPPGFKEGLKRGLEEGFRRGVDSAQAQFHKDQAQRLQAIADDFAKRTAMLHDSMAAALAEIRGELADETLALALEVARQVIRSQLSVAPQGIDDVVREAIASLVDERSSFVLHLNPDDVSLVAPALEPVLQERSARIATDPKIRAGGCRITSTAGEIDATLGTRWQRVLAAIGRPDTPLDEATTG